MEKRGFRKFITRLFSFLSPFLIFLFLELFVLPIDFFTYRAWEALKVESRAAQFFLPGPFYPNRQLSRTEVGDLGRRTGYTQKKEVNWEIDSWGFRADEAMQAYDILLVGDSTLVGTGLDQDETLAFVIASKSRHVAYPIGAKELMNVLFNPHFRERKPEAVVLVSIERFIAKAPLSFKESPDSKVYFAVLDLMERFGLRWTNGFFVTLDRLFKQNMYHSVRARIDNFFESKEPALAYGDPPVLFFQGDPANEGVPEKVIRSIADRMAEASRVLSDQGIRFVFLPVPNKETVYWNILPNQKYPTFLPQLTAVLRERNIAVVDTQSEFLDATSERGEVLYHSDDTHWNASGVRLAADLLLQEIGAQE